MMMINRFQNLASSSFVKSKLNVNNLKFSKLYSTIIKDYQPGKVVEGFVVKENRDIKALGLTGVVLEHQKSGAQLLHLAKEDESNNVFSIGFPTLNNTSDGVAHILEHTTLCGSQTYPVRDPFFKMMPRSLATYMNAWTANDFTQYPFSTQNPTDYYNLMSVYLDSVFKPILSEYDFSQEGWRIEKNPETNEWEFKGIVFNEMKGVFSDHGAVYYYDHQKHLYEGCVYNQVSGGHPLNIPELTWEHLKKFHDDHYHPNNAKIFTFGNFPLDQHLSKLNEKLTHTLETSPKPSPLPSFATHPTWNAPRKVVVKGPFDPMLNPEQQHKISVSWLTNEVTDTFTTMSLGLLFSLLTGTSGAPLQKALLDTHLGTEYSPTTGYSAQSPITSFSIGVQGVNPSNLEKIEKTIYETLESVSKEGFSKDLIEGALLNIELSFRHRGSNFGIRLVQSIMNNWNYGLNPLDPLEIDQHLAKLRSEIAKGDFFEGLIRKYLLDNPRKLIYIAEPSKEFEQQIQQQEDSMLKEIVKNKVKSEKDETKIQEFNAELQRRQMSKEDLGCLPTLTIDDIQKNPKSYPITSSDKSNIPITFRDTNTNGISYLKIRQSLPNDIPTHLRPFVPLLCECLSFLGCHDKSMAELDEEILLSTGGISYSPYVTSSLANLEGYTHGVTFASHALNDKSSEMYRLMTKILLETNFDQPDRIKTLILNSASSLNGSVADSGHTFARGFASGILSESAKITDIYSGMYQTRFMTYLANNVDSLLPQITQHLKSLHKLLINPSTLKAFIVSEQTTHNEHESLFAKLQNQLVSTSAQESYQPISLESVEINPTDLNTFAYPFNSYYSSRALSTVPFQDPTSPHYQILSTLLTHLYLHREIREKGGAYGGGATHDSTRGTLSFYSYRDPNPYQNCEHVYKQSLEWALNHKFEERELNEAKLSVFQSVDHPLSASQEGLSEWTSGITLDMAKARRHTFLTAKEADLKVIAEKLLHSSYPKGASVIIGQADQESISKGWKLIKPISV